MVGTPLKRLSPLRHRRERTQASVGDRIQCPLVRVGAGATARPARTARSSWFSSSEPDPFAARRGRFVWRT